MKTIDEYMVLPYSMEFTPDTDEGGYIVSFPDLKGCLTSGETIDDAVRNAEDAKREWLAAAIESGIEIPVPDTDDDYSGQFKLRIPKEMRKISYRLHNALIAGRSYLVQKQCQQNRCRKTENE